MKQRVSATAVQTKFQPMDGVSRVMESAQKVSHYCIVTALVD